jgi:hypothetical protein
VTVERTLAQRRRTAIRFGWNDAAWGKPRRELGADLAAWYERGYKGGLVFRGHEQQAPSAVSLPVPEPRALGAS